MKKKMKPIHGNTRLKPGMKMTLEGGKLYQSDKPDPVALGEELAEYLMDKWNALTPDAQAVIDISLHDDNPAYHVLRLRWERDFWREKALNP